MKPALVTVPFLKCGNTVLTKRSLTSANIFSCVSYRANAFEISFAVLLGMEFLLQYIFLEHLKIKIVRYNE